MSPKKKQLPIIIDRFAKLLIILFSIAVTGGWVYFIVRFNFYISPGFWLAALTGTVIGIASVEDAVDWSDFKFALIFTLLLFASIIKLFPHTLLIVLVGMLGQTIVTVGWVGFYELMHSSERRRYRIDSNPSFIILANRCAKAVPALLTLSTGFLIWNDNIYQHTGFILSVVIALFFALLYEYLISNFWLHFLTIMFMVFGIQFIIDTKSISSLLPESRYLLYTGIIWVTLMSWMEYYTLFISHIRSSTPIAFKVSTPTFLPSGFSETSRECYKRKGCQVVEIIYNTDDSEHLIWLKQANGPIPDLEPRKGMEKIHKLKNGVPVLIEHQILKPSRRKTKENPFIEANWSQLNINYNLRSDNISLPEIEGVIKSMIGQH